MSEGYQRLVNLAKEARLKGVNELGISPAETDFAKLIVFKIIERIEESITDAYDLGDINTATTLEALAITILDDFDMELPEEG